MAPRAKNPVINLSMSDSEGETIHVAPRSRRNLKRKAEPVIDLCSDDQSTQPRITRHQHDIEFSVLRELSPEEFQNRLRGPIAWVKRRKIDVVPQGDIVPATSLKKTIPDLLDWFKQPTNSASGQDVVAKDVITTPGAPLTNDARGLPASTRPKRAAAQRTAFDILMRKAEGADLSSSEDELLYSAPASKRKSLVNPANTKAAKRQSKALVQSETSDYDEDQGDADSPSSSEAAIEDSEDSGASEASEEVELKPSAKKSTKKQVVTKAQSSTATVNRTGKSSKGKSTRTVNLNSRPKDKPKGLDQSLPPIADIREIFEDLTNKALSSGFDKTIQALDKRPLRVATMCSGTESPLLALEMIQDASASSGRLHIEHLFSAEIVPFKQAYIERNFSPPVIFRDIRELTSAVDNENPEATTAYGSKVSVPKDVDIVIAGTSCVDFSNRNNHKKSLDDGGESGDTFNAVLAYCRAYHPPIVLLENVMGAPYDDMMSAYESIGYEAASVFVDTKNFYIPHTRQRGYMACFNRGLLNKAAATNASAKWIELMEKFRRPATAPISSFLLPSDQISHRNVRRDEGLAREVDWSQCEITQMDYRQQKKLGNARPLTHWSESGSILPPDNGYAPFYRARVERELDTMDVSLLRKARPEAGMFDVRFKTRIWDLSQNVYMNEDSNPFGITGCLTPTMRAFVSDAGRALDAKEALKLQGIPLEKISFTTETNAEIQDLAGNAMSSTVIGSSIVSALIAGTKILQAVGYRPFAVSNRQAIAHPPTLTIGFIGTNSHTAHPSPLMEDIPMSELMHKARLSLRRCYCESARSTSQKPIQRCLDCGHTTCLSCGGNPQHNYRSAHSLNKTRATPIEFEEYVRATLPLRLVLSLDANEILSTLPDDYRSAVNEAINATFDFQGIRRTHCWIVSYCAEAGRLELIIEETRAEWRLFADISRTLAESDPLRSLLKQPILKSNAAKTSAGTDWQLRVPEKCETPVSIQGSGRKVASWFSRIGLPEFRDHYVWEYLSITVEKQATSSTNLNGTYRYLPHCGTACEGLYLKSGDGQPIYFFLDPDRIGDPAQDCYIFSYDHAVLEYDEVRPIIARMAPGWRPWSAKPEKPLASNIKDGALHATCSWRDLPATCKLKTVDSPIAVRTTTDVLQMIHSNCHQATNVIDCTVMATEPMGSSISQTTSLSFDKQSIDSYAWIFAAMQRYLPDIQWRDLPSDRVYYSCQDCAPPRPALRWQLTAEGDIKSYEDPESAAKYERAIKSRPETIAVRICPGGPGGSTFALGVNFASLAHRALSRLPYSVLEDAVQYKWRLNTGNHGSDSFAFKPFKLTATRGFEPYGKDLHMSIQLFPKQLQALSWMRMQERGVRFELEEVEETSIPALGWRAEVRARAAINVRGGICADHPGFGKTITSLALVNAQFLESDTSEIISSMGLAQDESVASGLIPTSATLIVCPTSLLKQWVDEINDKLGSTDGVLAINAAASLNNFTVDDFKRAKIIVVNRTVLAAEAYIERLAAFAAIPGPATNALRGFAYWLDVAAKRIPEHVKILESGGAQHLKQHIQKAYRINLESEDFKATVPSRRLRGRNYVVGKQMKGKSVEKAALKDLDMSQINRPLFEMFYFNRVIVDEFHQYEPREHAATCALKADKRWLLSGTPAIGDFYEVAQMAKLLGVPLRIGSDERGLMKTKNITLLRKAMTDFERFDSGRQQPSGGIHAQIHDHHQAFLDTFVRQNIMDFAEFKLTEHLVPVVLEPDHCALYTELSQQFNSLDMRIKKGAKTHATDREDRFIDASKSSSTAEEALSKIAAFHNRAINENLDLLITRRHDEANVLISKLPAAFAVARSKEPKKFGSLKLQIEDGATFGDRQTTQELIGLMKRSTSSTSKTSEWVIDVSDDDIPKAKGVKGDTAVLNRLCKRLVTARRSARYLENVRYLQQTARKKSNLECDRPECRKKDSAGRFAVSALCGHKLCRGCHRLRKDHAESHCPATGCSSSLHDFHLLWIDKLANPSNSNSPYGAKLRTTITLLETIQEKQEQAILFVQFEEQIKEAEAALRDAGITRRVVSTAAQAGNSIAEFRESADTDDQITVIVLNASDETAAGSNLQNANHVIFLSPLLRDTQYGYESTMAQAIGRVRRYGQERDIHVYRLVALNTIDVDILEHRERRTNALMETGSSLIAPPGVSRLNEHGEPIAERSQLVREDERFSLRPQSWLIKPEAEEEEGDWEKTKGKQRVMGWEDFSSLVKFSKTYTEDDD